MVYVHLATGFEEIEAITVVDVLRRAEVDCKTVSVSSDIFVEGAHGVIVKADIMFDEADYDKAKMIILPGGIPGATNLAEHKGLTDRIKEFADENKYVAAICAAPMVFGQLGILEGKTAVIYPGFEERLTGAKIGRHDVEVDGNVITSRGPGTAYEFAFSILEILKGAEIAKTIRSGMLID